MSETGGVVISPNIKRQSDQINADGDKVKPFTKQVIEKEAPAYKPTKEEIESMAKAGQRPPGKPSDALGPAEQPQSTQKPAETVHETGNLPKPSGLAAQIKAMVNQAVQEALAGIDIKGLVADAIKEAFKDISL